MLVSNGRERWGETCWCCKYLAHTSHERTLISHREICAESPSGSTLAYLRCCVLSVPYPWYILYQPANVNLDANQVYILLACQSLFLFPGRAVISSAGTFAKLQQASAISLCLLSSRAVSVLPNLKVSPWQQKFYSHTLP